MAVVAYAGAQVKKGLDVAKRLGAENFIFWGGREGYQCLWNTNLKAEVSDCGSQTEPENVLKLDSMAAFLRMAVEYKAAIGFTGQLCLEPKPKEPSKHQYDYDAMTVIGFLRTYGLEAHFKVSNKIGSASIFS